jgi:hypothetical protein
MSRTYYDILGVPNGASFAHIKDSYRLLTRKTLITDAVYEVLTDPMRRREYDVELVRTHKPLTPWVDEWGSDRSNGNPINEKTEQSDGVWVELGAPGDIPQKPDISTQQELHYIAGVEKLLQTGILLENIGDTILDSTPEQLLEVAGISVETQIDSKLLLQWVAWLGDLVAWLKSLPADLAQEVLDTFKAAAEGGSLSRYKFLTVLGKNSSAG